jgi:hypothetical protein|tara:strand:+ start:239 stop:382 length:144 start_codon:yes stop_codon:yes gene_type:complete
MGFRKLVNSFTRQFSDYIALNSGLYLSHKPEIQIIPDESRSTVATKL